MSQDIPPVAVLISHRVRDYDSWKNAFDSHQSARAQASCLMHHVSRGVDDPNMVYVFCPATDVDRLKAFTDSPELANAMKNAGVEGPANVRLMIPKLSDVILDRELPAVIVSHPVEDYDTWRAVYDEGVDLRKRNSIVGHAVHQELGKPNQVIVYNQSSDLSSLRTFVDSTELKEVMQRAGVTAPPDIDLIQGVDYAEY
jgi:quinol monooxygenase YgiN